MEKPTKRMAEWIKKTVNDGVFATEQDALVFMAFVGICFCERYGIDREVVNIATLPLNVKMFDKKYNLDNEVFTEEGFNKLFNIFTRR